MQHARRLEDAAQRFAEEALRPPMEQGSYAYGIAPPDPVIVRNVARTLLEFHRYAEQHKAEHKDALQHALRRISDPSSSVPLATEHIGQAERMLRNPAVQAETIFLSRSMLAEALKLLGRADLLE